MARTPAPERITHNGREMVLLTPEEYAALAAARRQAGALSQRLQVLTHELRQVVGVLSAAEAGLTAVPGTPTATELQERIRARLRAVANVLGHSGSA
jgi:hypothetical protein